MTSEQFINENSSPYEFWDGYEGRLIAKTDAKEAAKKACVEGLNIAINLVQKYEGVSIQLADILKRELETKIKEYE